MDGNKLKDIVFQHQKRLGASDISATIMPPDEAGIVECQVVFRKGAAVSVVGPCYAALLDSGDIDFSNLIDALEKVISIGG